MTVYTPADLLARGLEDHGQLVTRPFHPNDLLAATRTALREL
jgi:hypothetical protein